MLPGCSFVVSALASWAMYAGLTPITCRRPRKPSNLYYNTFSPLPVRGAVLIQDWRSYISQVVQIPASRGGLFKFLIGMVLAIGVAAVSLWAFDKLILYFTARSYVDDISWTFNLNRNLADAVALGVFVLLVYLVSKVVSFSRQSRLIGAAGIVLLLIVNSLVLWQGTKGQYFDKVGSSTKCYVLTREGSVKYLERAGVDPETGRACRPYTVDMLERLREYEKGKRPERIVIDDPTFFDPRTGEPIVWYVKGKTGRIELFNLMGFHPDDGAELQPVSREISDAYKAQIADIKRRPPAKVDPDNYPPYDPVTGQVRIWYWQGANAEYEFYDNRGFHPRTGEPLTQVTRDVLEDHKKRTSQRCYIITRDSVRYGTQPGIDAVTGRMCRELTPGLWERLREYEKGNRPKPVTAEAPVFFDLRTGDPALWYSQDAKGNIRLFDLMGFDPESGDELLPVTKEIPDKWKDTVAISKAPPRQVDPATFDFYDPVTGKARAWYWRSAKGEYEFYNNQGFHPRTGEPLLIITPVAQAAWKKYVEDLAKKKLEDENKIKQAGDIAKIEAQAGELCDQAAGNPTDPKRPSSIPGVEYQDLKRNPQPAVEICTLAVQKFPQEPRYRYNLGRAFEFVDPQQSLKLYAELARQKYVAVFDNYGGVIWREKDDLPTAIRQYEIGVQLGDPSAMVSLAWLIKKNRYQISDPVRTRWALLVRASQAGHKVAQETLEREQPEFEAQAIQQQNQQQQQQMMMNLFQGLLRGIVH